MKQWRCPECGGRHFGTVLKPWRPGPPPEHIEVIRQVCHDEHGVGCKWTGLVDDSESDEPNDPWFDDAVARMEAYMKLKYGESYGD